MFGEKLNAIRFDYEDIRIGIINWLFEKYNIEVDLVLRYELTLNSKGIYCNIIEDNLTDNELDRLYELFDGSLFGDHMIRTYLELAFDLSIEMIIDNFEGYYVIYR